MKTKSKITMGKEREILSKQEAIGSEKKKLHAILVCLFS